MPEQANAWDRVKAVFLDAVERPPAERNAFLLQACGDDDTLRAEVESLLASEAAATSFAETPAPALLRASGDAEAGPRLQPGMRLGVYEISGFIAAGGMGAVYRARHTVLGRTVALKTVRPQPNDPAANRRLIREARHASSLSHPNICTIYEVGSEAGSSGEQPFIAMELVDGRSLHDILEDGPLDLARILDIGLGVADALAHAHAQGIVHRDLKSANVMLGSDGRAIVLDFGVAKRLATAGEASRESTLTALGTLAGTLSHMAPEILLGAEADVRGDVWALGVLLYELATGSLPFLGRTPYETSSAILGDPPRPMDARVPLALRLVIERCLIKDPDRRYQRARDVHDALDAIRRRRAWPLIGRLLVTTRRRTLAGAAAVLVLAPALLAVGVRVHDRYIHAARAPVSTLALLPLRNATGDSSAAYYAQGVGEALTAQLGALANVRVIAPTSAARAAGASTDRATIGRQLGADVLAEGVLRRTGDRVALDMRLVDPAQGRVLWSDSYDRDARDVLALQADVVRALALAIRLAIRPDAGQRLATVRAVRPDVYEAYLEGRYEWNQRTEQSLRRAVDDFTRATQLDPSYAPAHAALADCFNQLGTVMVGSGSPKAFRPRAAAEAIKALQLDPYSAEAHAALGYVRHYELRWPEAEQELRRAIELNPNYALARIWYANLLMSRRQMDASLQQVVAARALDPFSLVVNTNVGWVLEAAGRHAEAIAQLERTLALDSTYVQANMRLATALASAGRNAEALARARRVMDLTRGAPAGLGTLGAVQAQIGHAADARATLRELVARSRTEYVSPFAIATIFAELGDAGHAMPWLEKTIAEGSNAVAYFPITRELVSLRPDPRFHALLSRAGLE